MSNTYPPQLDSDLEKLIKSIFQDYLVCAFISGRMALYVSKPDSDIDVFVILQDQILDDLKMFRQMWKQFVEGYRDIHIKHGFKPDNQFPGDFATVSQIYDVVSGRGFVEKDGQLFIQPMSSIGDENNENDYRIFRSMLVIGRPITGNISFFKEIQALAMTTLIKYILIVSGPLTLKGVITELTSGKEKEKYGYDLRYEPFFSKRFKSKFQNTLDDLCLLGYAKRRRNVYFSTKTLDSWGKSVLRRKWTAQHLLDFQDLYYVRERARIFKGINASSHWVKLK